MARPLRIEYPGAVYHITARGNEKKTIFKDDTDRGVFLNTLVQVNKRYNWLCHAYCLMGNHYHLLIETPDGNLSIGMRQLNGMYTQTFNKRHLRAGHLLQGRYKAILIQKDSHLLEACRYVVLNPVRAGLVKHPGDWIWGSYNSTAGKGIPHACLTLDWILGQFNNTLDKAEKEYKEFVSHGVGDKSIWVDVKGQSILGDDEFVDGLKDHLKKYKDIPDIPKSQRYLNRPSLEEIFKEGVLQDKRNRNEKILEAVEKYGYRQREVADYLGIFFTSVSRIMKDESCQMTRK